MILKLFQKRAFTLAEVLITLGVIGVVAAITLPTLIKNYQKHVVVTQLKKVYTELSQAYKLAEVEYGDYGNWDLSDTSSANNFKKYINQIKIIGETTVGDVRSKRGITYKQLSGEREYTFQIMYDTGHILVTNSGYHIFTNGVHGHIYNIVVDINGFKGPNTFGKDLFSFIYSKHKFYPHCNDDKESISLEQKDRNTLLNGPSNQGYQCNKSGRGMWCAAVIIKDGWKISDDYPW